MATLGEYIGAGAGTTKLLLHLNGSSADSSGNSNSGTDTAITYSQANGKFGMGAGFNGSTSKIVIPNTTFNSSSAFSISFWLKHSNNSMSFFKGYWSMLLRTNITNNRAEIGFSNNGVGITTAINTPDNSLPVNTFNHITITSTGSNQIVYINGVNVGSSATTISNLSTNIGFGANINGVSEYLNGSIDEVIIESVAWTPQQVAKYYSMSKGRWATL